MNELAILNLTFLCHRFRLFLLLRFLARPCFIIDLGFFLLFHFGIRNFVLSTEISHANGCVCKINNSILKLQNILLYLLTYTLQRFDVEFSRKDYVTRKMVIFQCMQILCSLVRHTATLL